MQAAPGADTNNRPPNKPPMEQPKRPAAALGAQIALEALPTPPAPQRVPTKAPATRPATATATRPARDIQGSMESAGAQQAQRPRTAGPRRRNVAAILGIVVDPQVARQEKCEERRRDRERDSR